MNTNNLPSVLKASAVMLTLALTLGFASAKIARAQASELRGLSTQASTQLHHFEGSATGAAERGPQLSMKQINAIRAAASRTVFLSPRQVASLELDSLYNHVATHTAAVTDGQEWHYANYVTTKGGKDLQSAQSVVVLLSYEPRPLGGILEARVDLRPTFSGVGVCNRPYVSEGSAQVIEEVNPERIRNIVATLTSQVIARASSSFASN